MNIEENIKIIKEAYSILKESYGLRSDTLDMQASYFKGLTKTDYKNLDDKSKAMRQDFIKILTTINGINHLYSSYQKGEYQSLYYDIIPYSDISNQLNCFIEYLFIKYSVIFEYIQGILEICIPYKFNEEEKGEYNKLIKNNKKWEKFDFLLNYISTKLNDEEKNLINIEWFKQIINNRNRIVHAGSTAVTYLNKDNLLFKVRDIDSINNENDGEENSFFMDKKRCILYKYYWGLQISKLIIFSKNIFQFLLKEGKISKETKIIMEVTNIKEKGRVRTLGGDKLPDIQSSLEEMLKIVIVELDHK